jgi:hypothetical protein
LTVANLPPLSADGWRSRMRLWFALGILELAYGLLIWFLARYWGIWWPGASLEPGLLGPSIKGTELERNLFGIQAATLFSVCVYVWLDQRRRGRPVLASTGSLVVACVLSGSAVVLSLTRSAWLALVLASPMAYLLFDRRRLTRADRPLLQASVGLPVLLGAFLAILLNLPARAMVQPAALAGVRDTVSVSQPFESEAIADRVSTLGRLNSDFTVNTRVQDARWAVSDWLAKPLLGRGTGSFVQLHGVRVGTDAWISNLALHTLVDTGLVGLAIQTLLFVLVARRTWRAAAATAEPQLQIGLKALTLGFVVMAIAYQVTDGTWLAVFWIHLGLMVNAFYCAGATAKSSVTFDPVPVAHAFRNTGIA